jgi:hypothetical protein
MLALVKSQMPTNSDNMSKIVNPLQMMTSHFKKISPRPTHILLISDNWVIVYQIIDCY